MLGRNIETIYLGRCRELRKDLCDPHCVAGADVCDPQVIALSRDGRVQHVLEAVLPKPVLQDEAARGLVAAGEDVVVLLVRFHLWQCIGGLFETF